MPTRFSSARHQEALATPTGYRRFSRFTFSRNGVTRELEPIAGSITQDARRNGRWDGRMTFAGDDVMPQRPGDLLTPFGTEVVAELGLELLDGSVSTVPYGTFTIGSAKTTTRAGERVTEVGLIDVSDRVDRYRFEAPFTVASGVDTGTMVNTVVTNRTGFNPGVGTTGQTLSSPIVYGLEPGIGPWAELVEVMKAHSRVIWYDRVGDIQVSTTTVDADTAYPMDDQTTSLSSDFDTRPPNMVVVTGESQDGVAPVYATAIDSDPSSPTYAGTGPGTSPYGRVPQFYSKPSLNRVPGMAQLVANMLLQSLLGAGASHTLVRPYDPTITAGDVISFDGKVFVVDAATVNLAADSVFQVREL